MNNTCVSVSFYKIEIRISLRFNVYRKNQIMTKLRKTYSISKTDTRIHVLFITTKLLCHYSAVHVREPIRYEAWPMHVFGTNKRCLALPSTLLSLEQD